MSNNDLDERRPNRIARRCSPPRLNRRNDRFLRKVNRRDHALRTTGASAVHFKEIGRQGLCPRRRGTRRHQHDLREELTGLRGGIRRGFFGPSLEGGFCFCEERLGGRRIGVGVSVSINFGFGIGDVSGDNVADGVREGDPGVDGAAEGEEVVHRNNLAKLCDGSVRRNVVCNVASVNIDFRIGIGIRGVSRDGVANGMCVNIKGIDGAADGVGFGPEAVSRELRGRRVLSISLSLSLSMGMGTRDVSGDDVVNRMCPGVIGIGDAVDSVGVGDWAVSRKVRGCSVSLHGDCSVIGSNFVPVWPRDGEESAPGFVDRPSRGRVSE